MNMSRGYLLFVVLLVLSLACGGLSTGGTSVPEDVSVAEPTPTTAFAAAAQAFPAESILIFNGDPDPLDSPNSIALDSQGNSYVVDNPGGKNRIVKFDSNGQRLSPAGGFVAEGNFVPQGVAVDGQDSIYVADGAGERVLKFDSEGNLLNQWGSLGEGEGQFNGISDIEVDGQGNVFALDKLNYRIQKFDSEGKFLTAWGSQGEQNGQFSVYIGNIAIDSQGNVYVTEASINQINVFDNNGQFLTMWEHIICTYGIYEIKGINGMWFDSQDRLFMGVFPPGICVLDQNGAYLGDWGTKGTEAGQFDFPIDLVGDNTGNIYVLEYSNNRIQKFEIK